MNKLSFASDYQEGAHLEILNKLFETNFLKTPGYGQDEFCDEARELIRSACGAPDADIHFLVGGTQANETVIAALLRPVEGVISAESGHINVHEAGAIEYTGHKVLTLPHHLGKITAQQIDAYCQTFENDENRYHMVKPGMVYISQPTEYGTLYTLDELKAIRSACDAHKLKLYADGARLAYALASRENNVSLKDMAKYCDVFYIGGTKCGCLFGEAVVIPDPSLIPDFFTITKQHGAHFAKGRLMGIQFGELFKNSLYERIGKAALDAADEMRMIFEEKGYTLAYDSPTNQIFVILENQEMQSLFDKVEFSFWERYDDTHTVVRFATSWATDINDVRKLREIL